jgi:RNA polymerase sigma factor (sigma-70 family)
MATSHMSEVIQHLHRTALLRDGAGLTDVQLLEDYINRRDEAALAALVHRHGPMVWGVCRRVLRDYHEAEDAFQATFLVFVRKAASIASRNLLANWLYGVAHQTALKARATAARRKERERQVTEMPEPSVADQDFWRDLQPLLDEELSRLPDKYRCVIVLCDLEGKTRKEAARQLGCPEGTVGGWLARARAMLGKRLAQRGVALSGGALAAVLSQNVASAGVPTTVVADTIKAATLFAAGQVAATGAIPVKVAALAEGVMKTMLLGKLRVMTAVLLMVGIAMLTTTLLAWGGKQDKPNNVDKPAPTVQKQTAQAPQKDPPKDFTNDLGMRFVWIRPGNFTMGSPDGPDGEEGKRDDETQHKVTLTKGFYMGVHLVTQEQWHEVMGKNPSIFKGEKNLPVENVSWEQCQSFVKKLREKDKKPYRLPTEAEWEYSCRAGTTTPFHFGATISTDQANYDGTFAYGNGKKGEYREKTTPVDAFPANAWGLHDMHGNLWQWCQDWYDAYPKKDVVDPQGPEKKDAVDPWTPSRPMHVGRGGCWQSHPVDCRSARRGWIEPTGYVGSGCSRYWGLRVCFSPD